MRKHAFRVLATVFAVALLMAACSSDDGTDGSTDGSTDTSTPSSGGGGAEDQADHDRGLRVRPQHAHGALGQDVTIELTNQDDVEHTSRWMTTA